MKTIHKVIIAIVAIIVIAVLIYIFRNQIKNWWVALSAIYGALISQFPKIKNFFSDSDDEVDSLKKRLEDSRKIENELIDVLMKERQVYRDKMAGLESEYKELDQQATQKRKELENYQTFDKWRENVYSKMPAEEKEKLSDDIFGKVGSLSDISNNYEQ
jgi:hypothetical protein